MKSGLPRKFRISASQLCLVLLCAFAVGTPLSAWLWYSSAFPIDSEPVVVSLVVEEPPNHDRTEPRVLDVSDLPSHRLRAEAAVVYNAETHEILWGTGQQKQRPIASITKVMTALVVLDRQIDLARDVVVSARDVRRASTTYLRRRERVTLDNLMHLALIASDNAAARVLARATGLGTKEFVQAMNKKADELGLQNTQFVDPSGLH